MRYLVILLAAIGLALGCGSAVPGSTARPISVPAASPSITDLAPTSTPINSVPFTMTVNGNNFGKDAIVFWNGRPLRTTFITSKQLTALLTENDLMFAGLIPVYVRAAGLNSNTVTFTVGIQ